MAANVPNPGQFVANVGRLFVEFRNTYQAIVYQNNYVAAMGESQFLTDTAPNGMGMESDDAAAMIAALGNITNLSGVQQAIDGTQPFWGGA